MRALRPKTQAGRILCRLVQAWPDWIGGPGEFGIDFHTARNRLGDALKLRGFKTVGRKRAGRPWWEYRLLDEETFLRALETVRSWETQRARAFTGRGGDAEIARTGAGG